MLSPTPPTRLSFCVLFASGTGDRGAGMQGDWGGRIE